MADANVVRYGGRDGRFYETTPMNVTSEKPTTHGQAEKVHCINCGTKFNLYEGETEGKCPRCLVQHRKEK